MKKGMLDRLETHVDRSLFAQNWITYSAILRRSLSGVGPNSWKSVRVADTPAERGRAFAETQEERGDLTTPGGEEQVRLAARRPLILPIKFLL